MIDFAIFYTNGCSLQTISVDPDNITSDTFLCLGEDIHAIVIGSEKLYKFN